VTVITIEEARRRGLLGKPKRVKKPSPPASYTPHRAVILGIDSAKRSGWGVLKSTGRLGERSQLLCHGESEDLLAWRYAVQRARDAERIDNLPLIVVMETWTTGGRTDRRMGPSTLIGLGESRGHWKELLKRFGHPRRRIIQVNVMTWRSDLFGGPMNRTSEQWKSEARRYVEGLFKITVGPDEAEGICIAVWGSQAGHVGALLPKRR
jgi:hypothetical protein